MKACIYTIPVKNSLSFIKKAIFSRKVVFLMKQVKLSIFLLHLAQVFLINFYLCIIRYLLKNCLKAFFSSFVLSMNKTFSKSYFIPPLEHSLDNIVLNYSLLDTSCFICAYDNFIRVTSLCDRKLNASNITAQLNQCREKLCQHSLRGKDSVKQAYMADLISRNHNWGSKTTLKKIHEAKTHKNWTTEPWNSL